MNKLTDKIHLVDLHVHTSASDGTYTPAEVITEASRSGLMIIAITDHDTLAGLDDAEIQGHQLGIRVIRGIELSAEYKNQSVHMLGLGLAKPDTSFAETLQLIHHGRLQRNPRIVRNLNQLGYDITMDDVRSFADGDIIGRIHIAQAMMHRGYVDNIDEAFHRFIGRGKPAYEERFRLSVEDAVEMIHRIEGLAIVAHPGLLSGGDDLPTLRHRVSEFRDMGIDGVETHYPTHDEYYFTKIVQVTREFDLLESGGSDYHGLVKSNQLGFGSGNHPITTDYLHPLLERLGIDRQNCCG
ncbi:PHP domain-containing protein [bacterium]|nr:PHP domain-containing protein [candidate division CSSED10-310 bacterium]